MALTSKMAKALNMKGEEMIEFFEDGLQAMRMNYYPPCPEAEKVLGVRSHSDSTGLTIFCNSMMSKVSRLRKMAAGFLLHRSLMPSLSTSETCWR